MTANTDLDRLLAEWLDDGPRRAPDRPLELAVQHARSHPRRPDPLRFVRPDAMAPRRSPVGLRPVLVLASLALLLVAVVVVGGGGRRDVIQPPVVSPSAVATEPPVSPSPSAQPSGFFIELEVAAGQPQTVTVDDASGSVTGIRSGSPEVGGSFPFDSVSVTNIDDTTLQLGWSGYPCATDHSLTIAADGRSMVLTRPACSGDTDTIALDRILILEFAEPIDAADIVATMEE